MRKNQDPFIQQLEAMADDDNCPKSPQNHKRDHEILKKWDRIKLNLTAIDRISRVGGVKKTGVFCTLETNV